MRTCFLSSFLKIHSAVVENKSKNISANQRPGRPSWISDWQENPNLVEDVEDFLSVKFRQNQFSGCIEVVKKMFQPIGSHLGFPIGTKNTNLVEDIEDLLPVKFCQNPFRGFEEVKKCFSQSEARTAILDFGSAQKTQTW